MFVNLEYEILQGYSGAVINTDFICAVELKTEIDEKQSTKNKLDDSLIFIVRLYNQTNYACKLEIKKEWKKFYSFKALDSKNKANKTCEGFALYIRNDLIQIFINTLQENKTSSLKARLNDKFNKYFKLMT